MEKLKKLPHDNENILEVYNKVKEAKNGIYKEQLYKMSDISSTVIYHITSNLELIGLIRSEKKGRIKLYYIVKHI